MKLGKTHFIVFCVGIFLGLCTGFFTGKAIYDKPLNVGIKRDTVVVHDTIVDVAPVPKDIACTRYVTRYLPLVKRDTVDHFLEVTKMVRDTVGVEIPITSKHYGGDSYDAWVSGFEPSLDSIKVYQRTEYITETITRMKPPNKWELDIIGGINYATSSQHWLPYAGGELMLNRDKRLQLGIEGGVMKEPLAKQWTPFAGAKIRIKVL